ncbi:MAG: penicillin-insensitive murein endopeptidase [Deltaproteobacteria bacterium]|nr:penicillin-insensitive murein endopeptidase [Deltaproteobacteria bacterium]
MTIETGSGMMRTLGMMARGRAAWTAVVILALGMMAAAPAEARKRKGQRPRYCPKRYKVVARDKLSDIARSLQVDLKDLKKWNGIKKNRVRRGRRLRYMGPCRNTESVGKASRGKLRMGVSIDPDGDSKGNGWKMSPHRNAVWATPETIKYVKKCAAQYRGYFPKRKASPLAIGDLSRRHGGKFSPHLSHQSGRDVDIGFLLKKNSSNSGRFKRATPRKLDTYKQWVLTKCFLDNPQTQFIFMEHSLVRSMKEYIKRIYRKRTQKMRKYLRYFPGGSKHVIRGDRDHRSHMHVRFKCPKGDRKCVN